MYDFLCLILQTIILKISHWEELQVELHEKKGHMKREPDHWKKAAEKLPDEARIGEERSAVSYPSVSIPHPPLWPSCVCWFCVQLLISIPGYLWMMLPHFRQNGCPSPIPPGSGRDQIGGRHQRPSADTGLSRWPSLPCFSPNSIVKAPTLWPPDVNSRLIGKDLDAGEDWRQKERRVTEDEMVGWHYWFNGHELG